MWGQGGRWGSLDALLGVWGGGGRCVEISPESRRCLKAPRRAEVGALRQALRSVTAAGPHAFSRSVSRARALNTSR